MDRTDHMDVKKIPYERPCLISLNALKAEGACGGGSGYAGALGCGPGSSARGGGTGSSCVDGLGPSICATGFTVTY